MKEEPLEVEPSIDLNSAKPTPKSFTTIFT
jgi:hypothetical protein